MSNVAESHRQPRRRCRGSRWCSTTRERRRSTPPHATVPSSAWLDFCLQIVGAALEGAYLSGRPGGNPVFLTSRAEWAARGCVVEPAVPEPTESAPVTTAPARPRAARAERRRRTLSGRRLDPNEGVDYPDAMTSGAIHWPQMSESVARSTGIPW